MATFLFDEIIFGPVQSRRLGRSLGVNLLPTNIKVCSFNCIYCECGWTKATNEKGVLPTREQVRKMLQSKLEAMTMQNELPDVITFAGNGEPTMHPQFSDIIDDTLSLRNQFAPSCRLAVLSNGTMLGKKTVFDALLKVDDNIQKLDSAIDETAQLIDCPIIDYSICETIERLKAFKSEVIIQTMFLRGEINGKTFDNTTEEEVSAWVDAIKQIKPKQVMLYSLSRDTPADKLEKVETEELRQIAEKLKAMGINVQVA